MRRTSIRLGTGSDSRVTEMRSGRSFSFVTVLMIGRGEKPWAATEQAGQWPLSASACTTTCVVKIRVKKATSRTAAIVRDCGALTCRRSLIANISGS